MAARGSTASRAGDQPIRDPSRVAERPSQVIAGALAPAALLGGQTAVLMVMRVTLALGGAGATRGQACLERRELRVRVRVGLAAEDAPGVDARVGAVEAEPDAAGQRFNIGLGEARVGADRARRGARGALVDARRERGDVGDEWTSMRSEDLFDAHIVSFGWIRRSREASVETLGTTRRIRDHAGGKTYRRPHPSEYPDPIGYAVARAGRWRLSLRNFEGKTTP